MIYKFIRNIQHYLSEGELQEAPSNHTYTLVHALILRHSKS